MSSQYNRTAAFIEYCKGTTIDEISFALAIPIDHLKRWEREDKWSLLVPKMELAVTTPAPVAMIEVERTQEKIRANREKNAAIFAGLQQDLIEVIGKLRKGELKVKRVFANGSSVDLDPSLRDRCDLALYAKNVAEGSYRALGDIESAKNASADSGLPSAGQITIVLPGPVSSPREARALEIESEVIEITSPPRLTEG